MTGLWIELRRGPGPWLFLVLLAAGGLHVYTRLDTWSVWTHSTEVVANAPYLMGPVAAGVAAWAGARGPRRGTQQGELLGARGPMSGPAAEIAALVAWVLAADIVLATALFTITATKATWGGPSPLWLATSAAGLAVQVPVGWLVGRLLPLRLTGLGVAVGMFALNTWVENELPQSLWQRRLFPVSMWIWMPFDDIRHPPLWGQLLWYVGVGSAIFTILAMVTSARWRQVVAVGVASLVASAGGVGTLAVVGGEFYDQGRHVLFVCEGERPEVCVHPAFVASLPELHRRGAGVAAKLADTPFDFARAEQRPRGGVGSFPSPDAIAFGFDGPQQANLDVAAWEMATAALGVGTACFPIPFEDPLPGLRPMALVVSWAAADSDDYPEGPADRLAREAWEWLVTQPEPVVQQWITDHADQIRSCTLSYEDFR